MENTEETSEATAPKKKLKAKNLSKLSMVFASLWIAVLTICKAVKVIEIDITDIIYSGVAIVAIWSPTYLSIWLDKIKDIRFGDK